MRRASIARRFEVARRARLPRHGGLRDLFDEAQQTDLCRAHETRFPCAHQLCEESKEGAFSSRGGQHPRGHGIGFGRPLVIVCNEREQSLGLVVHPPNRDPQGGGEGCEGRGSGVLVSAFNSVQPRGFDPGAARQLIGRHPTRHAPGHDAFCQSHVGDCSGTRVATEELKRAYGLSAASPVASSGAGSGDSSALSSESG